MDILAGMKNANHEGFQKMMVNLYTLATYVITVIADYLYSPLQLGAREPLVAV
jgi:hypothetical protein